MKGLLWPALLAVAALAIASRTLPAWHLVWRAEGVRLLGADAYYHLRHARYARSVFPTLVRADHATHYPTGQKAQTPGLLDLSVALASLPDEGMLPVVAAWASPALCLAGFAALFALGRRLGGAGAGLLAAVFLLLYPGGFLPRTLLGFFDHHAAEVVLSLLALLGFLRCLDRAEADDAPRWGRPAAGAALPLAIFLFTWVGAPIHLLLLAVAILVLAAARLLGTREIGPLPETCARYGLGVVVVTLPAGLLLPGLVMDRTLFLLASAAALGLAVALAPILAAARASKRPAVAAMLLVLAPLCATLLAGRLPAGARLLHALYGEKTALVAEHAEVTVASLWRQHGVLPLLAAGAPVAAALALRADRGRSLLVSAYGALLVALWWRTRDYDYIGAPYLALLAALAVAAAARRLAARPRLRALAAGALALGLVGPIWPLRIASSPWPDARQLEGMVVADDTWVAAMAWLARETPAPTLPVDRPAPTFDGDLPYPEGTYGVWSSWDYGNLVNAIGMRPVVWSQGVSSTAGQWMFVDGEQESLARLDRECRGREHIRYVVLDARTMGDRYLAHASAAGVDVRKLAARMRGEPLGEATFGPDHDRSVAARLYFEDGDGLSHFRLVHASPERRLVAYVARPAEGGLRVRRQSFPIRTVEERLRSEVVAQRGGVSEIPGVGYLYGGRVAAAVKIFERVAGARVEGKTMPGAFVRARVTLGGAREYTADARADDDGRYVFTIPHTTARGPLTLTARRRPRARAFATRAIAISEEQVQAGAAIAEDLLPERTDEDD